MQILSLSLLIPIAYLGILVGSLATFSHLYRQRKINAKLQLEPYFPPHHARNLYLSLLHLPDNDPKVKMPDSVLRAALINRAIEDIYRIMEIRTRKGPLNALLQKGTVGDDMWQRLLRAEQEMEFELKDIVAEANALSPEWGQDIFQSATEMAQNRRLKEKVANVVKTIPDEVARWEQQREQSRRELEGDDKVVGRTPDSVVKPTSDDEGVIIDTPGADATSSSAKNKKKKNKK